jgi:hypothetical protein
MGIASHLGPWQLGTVRSTTGTTAGTVRNMGTTIVAQLKPILYTDAAASTAFWLPAGAFVTLAQFYTTTAWTGTTPTLTLLGNGTAFTTALSLSSLGSSIMTVASTAGSMGFVTNVGTADAQVTYTIGGTATAGAGVIYLAYIVRQSDGTTVPTYSTGP